MFSQSKVRLNSLLLGGCLAILAHLAPGKAQELPAPYNNFGNSLPPIPTSDQGYETSNPSQNPTSTEYQTSQSYSPYNQGYLVYVDSNDRQTLDQVRQIESGAFMQQFTDGRSVIQVGLFNQLTNAQQFWQQLISYGIDKAKIIDLARGQEYYYDPNSNSNLSNNSNQNSDTYSQRNSSKGYYIVVPTKTANLNQLQNQIQNLVGSSNLVVRARNRPKGSHVSVGPFQRHNIAKQWNKYLKGEGLRNSRVYYGR
ncbi:MAG: SPOR domain-containing protein [Cyanobacteria bacterium P01_A01_bin.84]